MRKMRNLLMLGLVGCCLASCVDKALYRPAELKPEAEYFDFSTTKMVSVNVNYGSSCANALLKFYSQNPIISETEVSEDADFCIFADENGCFKGNIVLPSSTDRMFIYSPTWGAPRLVESRIVNGILSMDLSEQMRPSKVGAATRAVAEPKIFTIDASKKLYSLFPDYDMYGNVQEYDVNGLLSNGDFDPDMFAAVQRTLWGGKTSKPGGAMSNDKLTRPTAVINTTILAEYEGKKVESVNLYFNFLTEAAWFENGIGYYYYKTGEEPSNPNDVKKYIILPNTSIPFEVPYTGSLGSTKYTFAPSQAPCHPNMKVQLLFEDEEGNVTPDFPPGYTVGYFLVTQAMGNASLAHSNTMKTSTTIFYSNNDWNAGGKSRYIALQTADGSIVYGVEDSSDNSFDDVLFSISGSPNYAIEKAPDLPSVDVDIKPQYTTETRKYSYLYEDIWPTGGDYDMNDVMVEHTMAITFNNNNIITSIEDTFVPVQPAGSANFVDAFAVNFPDLNMRGDITSLPGGAFVEEATNSVVLFTDAKTAKGKSFVLKRDVSKSMLKKAYFSSMDVKDLYNPFIIAQYADGSVNRTEVHLPKAKATVFANPDQIGSADDAYYINKGGVYPFGLSLPIHGFAPITEQRVIGSTGEYPLYNQWVTSGGKQNTDWYKYRNGR